MFHVAQEVISETYKQAIAKDISSSTATATDDKQKNEQTTQEIEKTQEVQVNTQWKKQNEQNKQASQEERETFIPNLDKHYVSLTFDDGPSPEATLQLLDELDAHNVKATFFVLWRLVEIYPDMLREIHARWHDIGNHSWSHANLTKLSDEEIHAELQNTRDIIHATLGDDVEIKWFRPPYGSYDERVLSFVTEELVLWDVDSLDWKNRRVISNLANVRQQLTPSSIILFHDIYPQTTTSMRYLIPELKSKGYEFIGLEDLMDIR